MITNPDDISDVGAADKNSITSAATIAAALFFLRREAAATGLNSLAGIIDLAVKEASELARPEGADQLN
ncbi:MAG: hypothetical protein QGH73_02115 [Rhodospirillales bacterium]|nr:hypothetical protein [Rhodospirillales bacterium]